MNKARRIMSFILVLSIMISMMGIGTITSYADAAEDQRAYMHGVNLLKVDGKYLLVFSSNNYLPSVPNGEWVDDVFQPISKIGGRLLH